MKTVHVTERTAWKTCRLYHHFSYTRGLVSLQTGIGPMWFGTGIHYALASYYKNNMHPVLVFDEWFKRQVSTMPLDDAQHAKAEDFHLLGMDMLDRYLSWARTADADWEVISVEEELAVEVAPGITVTGTLDLLVRWRGKLWVVDHKTCAAFIDPDALTFDDQMVVYLWLVWKTYNEVPGGALYSMLRKKMPADPLVLKSGKGISKAQNIDTTAEKYLAAIQENGFDVADYADVLRQIEHNEFFRREPVARSRRELQLLDQQLLDEALEMTRDNVPIFPTMTQDCLWSCRYRDLCRTRLTGGDVEFMIQQSYHEITDYDLRWKETHPRETGEG